MLRLIAQGKTVQTVATILGISPRTVYNHIAELKEKLRLESHVQLALAYLGLLAFVNDWTTDQ